MLFSIALRVEFCNKGYVGCCWQNYEYGDSFVLSTTYTAFGYDKH